MCSINGLVRFQYNETSIDINRIVERIRKIIVDGSSRGKDSFGFTIFNNSGDVVEKRYVEHPDTLLTTHAEDLEFGPNSFILLNNNRAEPTTEYVQEKREIDVQPYHSGDTWVVHNGTIANDKEIIARYNLELQTKIDSAVIPPVLDSTPWDKENLRRVLIDTLVGSYALAAYNQKYRKLLLATNYKPLSILYDSIDNVLYFSSLETYLVSEDYNRIYDGSNLIEVKPYTALLIDVDSGKIEQFTLYKDKPGKKKALICASSGLDSTVAATWAQKQGYDVTLIHFQYKCRAQEKEEKHISLIAQFLKVPIVTIQADFFKGILGGSRLYDGSSITKENEKGAELAIEWVPARNLIFLSIAAGYAEAKGIDYIVLGGNLEESGAYADNELIFQKKFNDLLPNALNLQNQVQVLTPVADLMKRDIVKLGLEINAPLHLTWSCYENGEFHCGMCGPCFMRKTAFKMLNTPEVIKYLND